MTNSKMPRKAIKKQQKQWTSGYDHSMQSSRLRHIIRFHSKKGKKGNTASSNPKTQQPAKPETEPEQ